MNDRISVGSQIKRVRLDKGLTQQQLADLALIERATLNKIENGKYNVTVDLLCRICNVLEVDITLLKRGN